MVCLLLLTWFDQSRTFYCLPGDKCITVWKRIGGICYVIPGKYFSLFKPNNSHVRTSNGGGFTVIWENSEDLIISSHVPVEIISRPSDKVRIKLYSSNEVLFDSLYTSYDGKYRRFKEGVEYINVDILENYAINKSDLE